MISLLCAAALAATVMTEAASDGVNTITKTIDDNGYVISETQTLVHVPQKHVPTTQVYRLELTDEVPYIVGADGVKRQVCLVDPAEYAMMTGRVDQVWRSLNATDSGRRQLHGKIVRTEIDATNAVKVTVYGDGYRFSELIPAKRSEARQDRKAAVRQRIRDNRISERQQKFREALEARKVAPVKEVTLEHNAATGKDEVK